MQPVKTASFVSGMVRAAPRYDSVANRGQRQVVKTLRQRSATTSAWMQESVYARYTGGVQRGTSSAYLWRISGRGQGKTFWVNLLREKKRMGEADSERSGFPVVFQVVLAEANHHIPIPSDNCCSRISEFAHHHVVLCFSLSL